MTPRPAPKESSGPPETRVRSPRRKDVRSWGPALGDTCANICFVVKIWIVSSSYPTSPRESINAGVLSRHLAISLRDRGHKVSVVTPEKPTPTRFDEGLEGHVIPWFSPLLAMADLRPSRRPADGIRICTLMLNGHRMMRSTARSAPPDGIIAVWGLPSGLFARTAAHESGAPYCVWLLGSDVWRAPSLPGGVRFLSAVIRESAAAFANSSDLAERAKAMTGLPVEYLPSVRRLPDGAREDPTTDLVYVGRLHHNKGPDVLVEALHIAARQGVRPKTEIYGSGEMQGSLQGQISRFGLSSTVTLAGLIAAAPLAVALRSASYLVIPSRIDSTPLVLGDAIQARVPMLATDVGDTGALVRRFRLRKLVKPGDPRELAAGVIDVLKPPATGPSPQLPDWSGAAELMSPETAIDRFLSEFRGENSRVRRPRVSRRVPGDQSHA